VKRESIVRSVPSSFTPWYRGMATSSTFFTATCPASFFLYGLKYNSNRVWSESTMWTLAPESRGWASALGPVRPATAARLRAPSAATLDQREVGRNRVIIVHLLCRCARAPWTHRGSLAPGAGCGLLNTRPHRERRGAGRAAPLTSPMPPMPTTEAMRAGRGCARARVSTLSAIFTSVRPYPRRSGEARASRAA